MMGKSAVDAGNGNAGNSRERANPGVKTGQCSMLRERRDSADTGVSIMQTTKNKGYMDFKFPCGNAGIRSIPQETSFHDAGNEVTPGTARSRMNILKSLKIDTGNAGLS